MRIIIISIGLLFAITSYGQNPNLNYNKFKQLKEELATPNSFRTASGAPGKDYYQQQADYKVEVKLDEKSLAIQGEVEITYTNNSPDKLTYLWLQVDQNVRAKDSDTYKVKTGGIGTTLSRKTIEDLEPWFDGGYQFSYVKDADNKALEYVINKTMMRVNLDTPLESGQKFTFKIKYSYNIQDRIRMGGRSGYEYFSDQNEYIFIIGQFHPRMAVYNDVEGWQHKQFLGKGEFATPFGNYDVKLTLPDDHIVGATGELQNPNEVLSAKQLDLFEKAKTADQPVVIVSEAEAKENSRSKTDRHKTWHFKAENVRDFAWASSRKFIWDAWGVPLKDKTVMAMSLYPIEGKGIYERYSTKLIAHTIKVYSKYTFDYPYPVSWSVNSKSIGMEYPMISFNWGRTEKDGTYSEKVKYNTIRVIIHEIGHNWFPMIVNSDERQWAWMDEGLNSFLQFITEQEFEENYPSKRGYPWRVTAYMKGDKSNMVPIMTNPESIPQLGSNSYTKASVALNILRETILGRELFDYAFKTYSERWKFKHPTPADFFRTMEDASGTDLDWFWRGWFYTTDHVDIGLEQVKWYKMNNLNPEESGEEARSAKENSRKNISNIRNGKEIPSTYTDNDKALQDFYYTYDEFAVTPWVRQSYENFKSKLSPKDAALINDDRNYYELKFSNVGGLVMPIIIEFEFKSGGKKLVKIPAEIWRFDKTIVTKTFVFDEEVINMEIDPNRETADTELDNNYWPKRNIPSKFDLYIKKNSKRLNEMQKQ